MIKKITIVLLLLASRLAAQPSNDCCSNAIVLPDGPYPVVAATVDSTTATTNTCGFIDPIDCNTSGVAHNSIWYQWTAPSTGTAFVSLCNSNWSGFNFARLGAYTGSCALTGSAAHCFNTSSCGGSENEPNEAFAVTGGTTYLFEVSGTQNGTSVANFAIDSFVGTPTSSPAANTSTPTPVNTPTNTLTPISSFTASLTPVDTPTFTQTPTITDTPIPSATPTCVPNLGFCFDSAQCCSTLCSGNICVPAEQGFTPTNTPTRTPSPVNTPTPLVCAQPIVIQGIAIQPTFIATPGTLDNLPVTFTNAVPAGHAVLVTASFEANCDPNNPSGFCNGGINAVTFPDNGTTDISFFDSQGNEYVLLVGHGSTKYVGGFTPGDPIYLAINVKAISPGDTINMTNAAAKNITVQAWDITGICQPLFCNGPTCQCIDSTFSAPGNPAAWPTPPLTTQFAICPNGNIGTMEWLIVTDSPPNGSQTPGVISISGNVMPVSTIINDGIETINAEHVFPSLQCETIDLAFSDTSGWHYAFFPLLPNCPCTSPSPTVTTTPTRAHRCVTFTPTPQATRGRKNLPYWFE